jgi:hypothetical protein
MQASHRISVLSSAALAACAVMSAANPAQAAPAAYQTAVTGNSPYVYYRFGETGIADGTAAADSSANTRNGEYNGAPTAGVAGTGLASDNAVQFSGTGTAATAQYMASPVQGFGNSLGTSSFEFVYKTNPGFSSTTIQSLFGVFSPSATPLDAEVTLNSRGNDALGALANTTRLYIKGQDGDGAGVHFTNATLYDGNYHHLVFTFDSSNPLVTGVDAFSAYVDGIKQTLTFTSVAATATDGDTDPDTFGKNFDFLPTFAGRNVRGTAVDANGLQRLANVTFDEAALYGSVLTEQQIVTHAEAAGFVVPEPGSLALAGFAGLGLLARRRRRA